MATARFAVGDRGWLPLAMALALCLQLLCLGPGARASAFLVPPVGAGGHLTHHSGPMRGRCVAAPSSSVLQPPQSQPARPKASLDLDSVGGGLGRGRLVGGRAPAAVSATTRARARARARAGAGAGARTRSRWVDEWVGACVRACLRACVNDVAGLHLPLLGLEDCLRGRGQTRDCLPPHTSIVPHSMRRPAGRARRARTCLSTSSPATIALWLS